jgi:hypothetical protein
MMEMLINIDLKKLEPPIRYEDRILLIGSCFTEHIGNSLAEMKFQVMQNPNGILFGPDSVCRALLSYVDNRKYSEKDLFCFQELYSSWQHHSRFSSTDPAESLKLINDTVTAAHDFLAKADWLLITLGSAFSYKLTAAADLAGSREGEAVANCHRAPAAWFEKELLPVATIEAMLHSTITELRTFNPKLKIVFTISPVRHIRDGVVDNNRSKARLITAVHEMAERLPGIYYFPAYELLIDVLRDYRFYDVDLVHPNYAATGFVMEKFVETCIEPAAVKIMEEVKKLVSARKHRPFQPRTRAHEQFLATHLEKTRQLKAVYPFLDLEKEMEYFSRTAH